MFMKEEKRSLAKRYYLSRDVYMSKRICLYSNYDISYTAACIFVCERLRMYRPMIDIHKIWW